jgi:transposase
MIGSKTRMQGKDMLETSATGPIYGGIDVCKDRLDCIFLPTGEAFSVSNDEGGWRSLKRKLATFEVVRIAMEATGKYHRGAARSLTASGYAVCVVQPTRARHYAEGVGQLAKTDRVDAKVLAMMAREPDLKVNRPPDPKVEELAELIQNRSAAVEQRTATQLRLGACVGKASRAELTRTIAFLDKQIERYEAALATLVESDPVMSNRVAILQSIPGIGPVIAQTLVATMNELGMLDAKQVAALAGLAPFARDSGTFSGRRRIRAGRANARRALYLGALSASRYNADLAAFYRRLLNAGKEKKLALIAVARKLLILANTLISQNRPWEPRRVDAA